MTVTALDLIEDTYATEINNMRQVIKTIWNYLNYIYDYNYSSILPVKKNCENKSL